MTQNPPKLWVEMLTLIGFGAVGLLLVGLYLQRNVIDADRARLITAFEAAKLCRHLSYPAQECDNLKSAKNRRVQYRPTDGPSKYIGDWIGTYTSPNPARKDVFLVALDLNGQVKYTNHTGTQQVIK